MESALHDMFDLMLKSQQR